MFKKITFSTLCLLFLAGCSTASTEPTAQTLTGEATYDSGEKVMVKIIKEGETISDVMIDTVDTDGNAITQIAQMNDPVTQDTSIPKEYEEQVNYLEDWIKANGTADIKTDKDGKAVDTAILEGCDINIAPIMEAVNNALANEAND